MSHMLILISVFLNVSSRVLSATRTDENNRGSHDSCVKQINLRPLYLKPDVASKCFLYGLYELTGLDFIQIAV